MSYIGFSKKLIKYNAPLLLVHWIRISSMSIWRITEHDERHALQHQTKILSNSLQMSSWHSKEGSQTRNPVKTKSIISTTKSLWEWFVEKESTHRFLTASRTMKCFMRVSTNILDESIMQNFGLLQNNGYCVQSLSRTIGTLRCIIFGTTRRPDCHQTRGTIVNMNQEAESERRPNHREDLDPEARLTDETLSQLEMVLRDKPNLRYKFHTMTSPKIRRSASLGKPRSIDRWIANWWPDEREIKMEVERGSLRIFFLSLRISQPRSDNQCVCDGGCTHTPCRTHIFLTHFPCITHRHRVHAWFKEFAVRIISPHLIFSFLMFHRPSLLFPYGRFDTSFPSVPSLPIFPDPKARVKRTSARVARSVATWPIPRTPHSV